PREDLTGQDVARKLLILARQTGVKMELDDVRVDSLVPRCLADGPFSQQFFSAYAAYDADMGQRLQRARARGAVLRYVGTLERGRWPIPPKRRRQSSTCAGTASCSRTSTATRTSTGCRACGT